MSTLSTLPHCRGIEELVGKRDLVTRDSVLFPALKKGQPRRKSGEAGRGVPESQTSTEDS